MPAGAAGARGWAWRPPALLRPHPLPPVARFEENQSGVAEMEEFLPHGAEKKQTHFTDVSISAGTAVAAGRGQLPV